MRQACPCACMAVSLTGYEQLYKLSLASKLDELKGSVHVRMSEWFCTKHCLQSV